MNKKLKSLVSESVINHRKDLNKSRIFFVLHETPQKIFKDHLNDINLIGLRSKMTNSKKEKKKHVQGYQRKKRTIRKKEKKFMIPG